MFDVYVEKTTAVQATSSSSPSGLDCRDATAAVEHASKSIKTKLIVSGHEGDITLAPRLHFTSFAVLKAQTEAVLQSLPRAQAVCLSSLQYRDTDGDFIDLLPSTFDPEDFHGVSRVLLRAKVNPIQRSPPLAPHLQGNKAMHAAGTKAPRRALGRRDINTMPAVPQPSATLRRREGASKKPASRTLPATSAAAAVSRRDVATPIAAATAAAAKAPPTAQKKAAAATLQYVQPPRVGRAGPRAPEFVFGAGATSAVVAGATSSKTAAPSRRRPRVIAPPNKPGWDNGNEPVWEEVRALSSVDGRKRASIYQQ